MEIWFDPTQQLSDILHDCANKAGLGEGFDPMLRSADPRFGDVQANGVLPWAKRNKTNPREAATKLLKALQESNALDSNLVEISVAGPGFINFRLTPEFLLQWMQTYATSDNIKNQTSKFEEGRSVVVDFSAPNTAKQMHVGHIRSTVIGEAISRLLETFGAKVVRDNHIGDWGTQFGMLIWAIKDSNYDLDAEHEDALADLENLYKAGNAAYKSSDETAQHVRDELVKLQNGDPENTRLWKRITEISWVAFKEIYDRLNIHFDEVLGESFYRDKVDRIYEELTELKLAEKSQGALVVFHPEHKRFAKQPFIIRKADGASNYATTDLATILYRWEHFNVDEVIYVVDARQSDHFEQLFLTTKKWFDGKNRSQPKLAHVSFGTINGEDGKAIKTKEGGSVKLKELMKEAVDRSFAIVTEKNPELPEEERHEIAEAVGLGAIRYTDLSQNRSSDYIFSWEKMLSFEGNTAPYLLYAIARIHSIFRKADLKPGDNETVATVPETEEEIALARKLLGYTVALKQARSDLRPHFLCTYLFELSGAFSSFYNANKVIVDDETVKARRLMLCSRTLTVLEHGLNILGLTTLKRM
jgi:arginyl-tRNA synthetase